MALRGPSSPYGNWASASDLAEYAYCPRSWYYRTHAPETRRTPESQRSASAGESYHGRTLARTWEREHRAARYVGVLLVGVLLAIGGVLWFFR